MKCRNVKQRLVDSGQVGDTVFHLFRRLIGEGNSKNVQWGNFILMDQMGDFMGDDLCLPRAGSGYYQ